MMFAKKIFLTLGIILTVILVNDCGRAVDNNNNGERPRITTVSELTDEDFGEHMKDLNEKIPAGFTIVVQKPFMVIGDESSALVKQRSAKTIKWAVDMLKKDYFDKDPEKIIDIWLFKDDESYYKHARELFGDEPTTPFGYFSEQDNALIMNIGTGGGTLVHEIVHPFIHTNFPDCPPWFDEGLASLYEQCRERDGHIIGLTNWRLEGLQEAIEREQVPSFKELTGMSSYKFYTEDKGTNYAQARYLCYYLQEKGRLVKFYREFHKNHQQDPTGYNTLQQVLNSQDMNVFKKEWETFVMKLTFP